MSIAIITLFVYFDVLFYIVGWIWRIFIGFMRAERTLHFSPSLLWLKQNKFPLYGVAVQSLNKSSKFSILATTLIHKNNS